MFLLDAALMSRINPTLHQRGNAMHGRQKFMGLVPRAINDVHRVFVPDCGLAIGKKTISDNF